MVVRCSADTFHSDYNFLNISDKINNSIMEILKCLANIFPIVIDHFIKGVMQILNSFLRHSCDVS